MNQLPEEAIKIASDVEFYLAALRKEPIQNHDQYAEAAQLLKGIKAKIEQVEERRLSITRPMDLAKQRIMDFFRVPVDKLKEAERAIKQAMIGWQAEVARVAKEAQDRIDEAARLKAEAEKAELEAKAVKMVQAGQVDKAADLVAKAEAIEPEPVQLAVAQPKVVGISTREIWKFRITDINLLPREFMLPDEKALGALARQNKGLVPIPGVEFYSEKVIGA